MDEVVFEENDAPWAEITEQGAVTVVKRDPRTQPYHKVIADEVCCPHQMTGAVWKRIEL